MLQYKEDYEYRYFKSLSTSYRNYDKFLSSTLKKKLILQFVYFPFFKFRIGFFFNFFNFKNFKHAELLLYHVRLYNVFYYNVLSSSGFYICSSARPSLIIRDYPQSPSHALICIANYGFLSTLFLKGVTFTNL